MDYSTAIDRIVRITKTRFSTRNLRIVDATSHLRNDLGLDSLDRTELIFAMEDAFDIIIPDQDVDTLHTICDIASYIEVHT